MFDSFLQEMTNKPQKLKIAAGIIFFNDCLSLKRCFNSLNNNVDMIFAIDGKFSKFPSENIMSTDGSRELTNLWPHCILTDVSGSEIEKRSKYIDLSAKYSIDVLIIIDSDEYILEDSNWEIFRSNLNKIIFDRDKCTHNVYAINLQTLGKGNEFLAYPRIWYKPEEMEYYGNKHYFYRNRILNKQNVPHIGDHSPNLIQGIKLGHDHLLRSEDHMKNRLIYQTWLENFEKSLTP